MSNNTRACDGCGADLPSMKYRGNPRKWCSEACRVRTYYRRNKEKREDQRRKSRERAALHAAIENAAKGPIPNCVYCGGPKRRRFGRYCNSPECQSVGRRDADALPPDCSEPGCGQPMLVRRLCQTHYMMGWRAANPGKASEINHRRRARLKEAFVEDVDLMVVLERDGWVCGICGEDIPRDVKWPHPLYRSLDHVVPLAKGGTHEYTNAQGAHVLCNAAKGDRLGEDVEVLI